MRKPITQRRRRARWLMLPLVGGVISLALGVLPWGIPAAADQFPPTSDEVKLGAEVAKGLEAHYRLVTNPAQVERITRIGDTLARVVERQDLTYHFKIIDIPGINALSLPGGWVYVTEGMMKFVRSDDELAAVLGHELTHINHRHYYIQQERYRHMVPAIIVAAAISVLAQSPAPLLGTSLVTQGAMSNYQRDLEKDADLGGIAYLGKTQYSPVAMLTMMEHLAELERYSAQPDPGIMQDHPRASERVVYIHDDLAKLSVPIVRRKTEGYLKLTLDPPSPSDQQAVTIRVDGVPAMIIGAAAEGLSPAQRAQAVAARLDTFFDRDPAPYDVRAVVLQDHWSVIGGEVVIFDVTPQDAQYAGVSQEALANLIKVSLARAVSEAPYNRKY